MALSMTCGKLKTISGNVYPNYFQGFCRESLGSRGSKHDTVSWLQRLWRCRHQREEETILTNPCSHQVRVLLDSSFMADRDLESSGSS